MKTLLFANLLWFICLAEAGAQGSLPEACAHTKAGQMERENAADYRQTPNQHDYDIHYYDLDIRITPAQKQIEGVVGIGLLVIEDSIDRIELNLIDELQVIQVTMNDRSLSFVHDEDILTLILDDWAPGATQLFVEIQYRGTPGSGSFHFDTRNGNPLIWTLSQPYGAREWWPCKDYPFDKADSARIDIQVPEGLIVGSNGKLVDQHTEAGWTRFVWMERYPITSYLISLAAHPYQIYRDSVDPGTGDTMELVHYIFPDHFAEMAPGYDITRDMLEYFSTVFGAYPFASEKYGHAEFPWNGGMEHQTLTSLLGPYEYLIAHELAHQWWGNMITCKDFHHIWLNEGFATYSEALWAEYRYGKEAYFEKMEQKKFLGEGTIYVPDLDNPGRIFSGSLSYNKASWVLHMLRHILGDGLFFECLRAYGNGQKRYGVATTSHFQDVCEQVSQIDLEFFFNRWIYGEGHPAYAYDWLYSKEGEHYQVVLNLAQVQAEPLFRMPVDVRISTLDSIYTFTVTNQLTIETYEFLIDSEPVNLSIDPDNWILKEVSEGQHIVNHRTDEYVISLADNGGLGFDRPHGNGNGLIFPREGENLLYFGTVLFGNNPQYLVDNDLNGQQSDLLSLPGSQIRYEDNAGESIQRSIMTYTDSGHPENAGITVVQQCLTSTDPKNEGIIRMGYRLVHDGERALPNFYAGVLLDLDIGYYLDNTVDFMPEEPLISQQSDLFAGLKPLVHTEKAKYIAVRNALDRLDESLKFGYLSGEKQDYVPEENDDWSLLVSWGPFELLPGDSLNLDYALMVAATQQQLKDRAHRAEEWYSENTTGTDNMVSSAKIFFFPNPVGDKGYLDYELAAAGPVHIRMLDLNGHFRQEIVSATLKSAGKHRAAIDFSPLPPGMYLLQLMFEQTVHQLKLIRM